MTINFSQQSHVHVNCISMSMRVGTWSCRRLAVCCRLASSIRLAGSIRLLDDWTSANLVFRARQLSLQPGGCMRVAESADCIAELADVALEPIVHDQGVGCDGLLVQRIQCGATEPVDDVGTLVGVAGYGDDRLHHDGVPNGTLIPHRNLITLYKIVGLQLEACQEGRRACLRRWRSYKDAHMLISERQVLHTSAQECESASRDNSIKADSKLQRSTTACALCSAKHLWARLQLRRLWLNQVFFK